MTRSLPFLATRAVALLMAVGAVLLCEGLGPHSPAAHSDTIEQRLALHIKTSSSGESPSQMARRVRAAIKAGDFAAAAEIAADVRANSRLRTWRFHPFTNFIGEFAKANDATLQTQLDAWVAQDRTKPIPLLIRARYLHGMAWFVRGDGFVREVRPADLKSFEAYLRRALDDVNAAIELDDGNPYSLALRLRILREIGARGEAFAAFDQAIAKFPGYYPLYETTLNTLTPKWGGSVSAMYAFVDKFAGRAAENSPLRLLYVDLYSHLLGIASLSCWDVRSDKDKMASCMTIAVPHVIKPELEASALAALALYDRADKYQFGLEIERLLNDMLAINGADAYASVMLELAARSMHGDTQLKTERPGPGNYIIDKIVAASWYRKGFHDNAIAKGEQALQAIEAAVFPSQNEKDLAIAGVYQSLSSSYSSLHRYAEMIAYETAAIALGGPTSQEHFICWGHYRQKAYDDAIRTCTDAISRDPLKMKAYFWRGHAHRDAGRKDEALRDLIVVANSHDSFRARAAIAASMIYFDRKDIRGALDLLNRYTYLFDPDRTAKDSVAVGYNNRCYAYMELGELKRALDDCTASLKYGNIPDAVRKRLELIERLKARETKL
jgi:tetratricopeptide (TPR) repeat protein